LETFRFSIEKTFQKAVKPKIKKWTDPLFISAGIIYHYFKITTVHTTVIRSHDLKLPFPQAETTPPCMPCRQGIAAIVMYIIGLRV
jgi:hypothetical protein